ncbi:MAG: T9SS type A sorting domain-containing protein [Crocinitomicaceae bacterium]
MSLNLIQAQEWEWARRVNGIANDYVSDIFVDDSSNTYITGRSKLAVIFEDPINPISPTWYGHTDAFIAKYDKDGNLLWANQGGSPEPDWGWGVVADNSGNTYYTGEFSDTAVFGNDTLYCNGVRDVFIAKLDQNGNFIWSKSFGGSLTDKGQDIEMDNSGNLYITGFIGNEVNIGGTIIGTNTAQNGYIIKLDTAGNYIHAKEIAPNYSSGYHLKSDDNGHMYLTGETRYDNYFSNLLVQGPGYSWRDAFLVKFDTTLQAIWVKTGAGPFHNIGESVAVSDNYVYMTGAFSGYADFSGTTVTSNGQGTTSTTHNAGRDIFIAKYDFSGNLIWVKSFGGIGYDYGFGIDVTSDDHIYVGGSFRDTVMFENTQLVAQEGPDMFFIRLDSQGDMVWIKQQSGSLVDQCYALALDEHENLYAGGGYRANMYFDNIFMPTMENSGYIGKVTQHTYPTYEFVDTFACFADTILLAIDGITTPLSYTTTIDQSFANTINMNNNVYIVLDSSYLLSGKIVVANNIYSDTVYFSQNISHSNLVPFSLGNDTTICPGTSIYLTPPLGDLTYDWSDNSNDNFLIVSQPDMYWLNIEDTSGCFQSDTISISNFPSVQFNLGNDTTICDYDSLLIEGPTGNFDFLWSNDSTTNNIYAKQTFNNWLTITDTNNCETSDTIHVQMNSTAHLAFTLGNDTTTCDYNTIELTGPLGNLSFYWNTTETTQNINVNLSDTYILTVTDSNQCVASDSIIVNFIDCLSNNEYDNVFSAMSIVDELLLIDKSLLSTPHTLYIYNSNGQVISTISNADQFDFSSLPSGLYIAYLITLDRERSTLKYIKR